tara:strand:- start:323 stop:505 length:183 start_codon:yes stop_codon:yes gene_type:complete
MKWLPTSLILFSMGIICVIAENAGARPWDSCIRRIDDLLLSGFQTHKMQQNWINLRQKFF